MNDRKLSASFCWGGSGIALRLLVILAFSLGIVSCANTTALADDDDPHVRPPAKPVVKMDAVIHEMADGNKSFLRFELNDGSLHFARYLTRAEILSMVEVFDSGRQVTYDPTGPSFDIGAKLP